METYDICIFLRPVSFAEHEVLWVRFRCGMWQTEHYAVGIAGIQPIVFMHLTDDGHRDSFYLLALVNSAPLNTGEQVSLRASAFSSFGRIPTSGISGLWGSSSFNFVGVRGGPSYSSTEAAPFCIPTTGARGSQFLHFLAHTCYFLLFLFFPFVHSSSSFYLFILIIFLVVFLQSVRYHFLGFLNIWHL